ncbi:CRISPR-associated protein Cas5 [uncultured Cutibacterium sp.]|uniref:CRISPR-associated protein Cas5 n=2 Tax=Cutibacterium namnetense TaxID=1574624 RepID=A0ABX9ID22_9ACTN|nr:CRISPR-associated protein Cas5 [Cutibacterium namnetense]TKW72834.1 MAG: CRISPR-associated protein Cas5 [Cutibacterium acnes]
MGMLCLSCMNLAITKAYSSAYAPSMSVPAPSTLIGAAQRTSVGGVDTILFHSNPTTRG